MSKSLILINVIPYVVFVGIGFGVQAIEFRFGKAMGDTVGNFLIVHYVFPLFILGVNFWLVKSSTLVKTTIAISLAGAFLVVGYGLMFAFIKYRIYLGLGI